MIVLKGQSDYNLNMCFQLHKISLIGNLVFTMISFTVKTESSVLKQSDEKKVVTACQGIPGRDGRDGRDGIQGPYGHPGNNGLSAEFEKKVEEILKSFTDKLRDTVGIGLASPPKGHQIEQRTESVKTTDSPGKTSNGPSEQSSTGGATYVRWGRNVCPPETLKLYSGFVAGSHYTETGSGANHMCLPINPQWNRTVAGHQSGSYLYGTEFELLESNSGFHRNNAGGKSQNNHDVLCAVCQTPGRLTHLMIPARLECPSGWNLEYMGFLMSEYYSYKKSEYVCVDQDPDVHPASAENLNGNLLHPVEVVCGSLPCPPYVDGYEVTCVVCTQ